MKKLKFRDPHSDYYEYTNDIDRIVKIFADRGYEISHEDAIRAWECFSNSLCASWLRLHEDDEVVFQDAYYYFEEVK